MIESALQQLRGLKEPYNATSRFIEQNIENGLGDKAAIVYDDQEVTYKSLQSKINQFGNALINLGMEQENRVLLVSYDSPEFAISFYGATKIGAVPIPVNTMSQAQDFEYFLNHSRAKVLVIHEDFWNKIKENKDRFIFLKHIIVISEGSSAQPEVIDFHKIVNEASSELEAAYTTIEDSGFWLYSSGSTGNPKGVTHRQGSMEAAFNNFAKNVLQITEEDRTFSASKLFFAYGLGNGLYFPLAAGGTSILMKERPTPEKVFEAIEKHKPTIFFGLPTLYGAMINYVQQTGKVPDLSSVRICVSAGEALPDSFMQKWKEIFNLDILDGIGSTEALHIFLSNRIGDIQPGSTGKVVPGYEAKIVNDDLQTVKANEVGDLMIKGDSITSGYWNNRAENERKFLGEWMYTGDKYYQDEDGYFWYSGRSDDMLKVGGIWVSPIEIETTLLHHESVLEVAVVKAKNENDLVYPKAYIVLRDGYEPTDKLKEDLKLYVKNSIAPYKYPREIEFISELPKTATGKIQRFKLKVD